MLENFSKIKIYNPLYDFVSYFVPVFVVFMLGYFFQYESSRNAVGAVLNLNVAAQFFVVLVVATGIGKFVFETTSYVLSFIQIIFFKFFLFLKKRKGVFGRVGTFLASMIPHVHHEEAPIDKILPLFEKSEWLKAWYVRNKMAAASFQTTLGSLFIATILYEQDRILFLALLIIALFISLGARAHLTHVESSLEKTIT